MEAFFVLYAELTYIVLQFDTTLLVERSTFLQHHKVVFQSSPTLIIPGFSSKSTNGCVRSRHIEPEQKTTFFGRNLEKRYFCVIALFCERGPRFAVDTQYRLRQQVRLPPFSVSDSDWITWILPGKTTFRGVPLIRLYQWFFLQSFYFFHHRDNGNCLRGSDSLSSSAMTTAFFTTTVVFAWFKILLRCFLPLLRCPADYTSRRGGRAV